MFAAQNRERSCGGETSTDAVAIAPLPAFWPRLY
jgi:hypothetical protein